MNADERKRLMGLSEKAAKGPWTVTPCSGGGVILAARGDPEKVLPSFSLQFPEGADAEFIAAAREAVPELLDALDESERIASNLDAVNKAIYRSMSEICGVAVDGFSDIQPVLMGLRVDADLFYSIKAENAALRERLERVVKAVREYLDDEDRDGLDDINLRAALARADKTDKEGQ